MGADGSRPPSTPQTLVSDVTLRVAETTCSCPKSGPRRAKYLGTVHGFRPRSIRRAAAFAGTDASTAPSPLVAVCGFAFVQSPSSECATTRLQSENEHFGVNEDLCAIGGADGDFAPAIGCAKPSASVCGDVSTPSLDRLLNIRSDRLTTHNSVSVRCTQTELSQAPWFVRWLR